jgi:hypothetical protein
MEAQTKQIETLADFIKLCDKVSGSWFRGHDDFSYKLAPSLFRHPTKTQPKDVFSLEKDLFSRFKQRSIPFLQEPAGSDLDYLFVMQHFGVPTRLLDWTENPFIALFFALHSSLKKDCDAAFFTLAAMKWNELLLGETTSEIKIFDTRDDILINGYKIGPKDLWGQKVPVSIFGNYNSPRIVAQKGTFVIFGVETKSMDEIADSRADLQPVLRKYTIPKSKKRDLFSSLLGIGVTDTSVYPDLEGLGREIKRSFGYEV